MSAKVLYMAGHHVRKGQAVGLMGSDGGPVRYYGEKRASAVRAIVGRFNRMQEFMASDSIQLHPISKESTMTAAELAALAAVQPNTAIITSFGQPQQIKVFQPGETIEHNGKAAEVVRMAKSGADLTGHVILTDRFGIHWEVWSNYCNCQKVAA